MTAPRPARPRARGRGRRVGAAGSIHGRGSRLGLLLAGPLGWLVDRLPRVAGHPAAQRVLGEGRVHRQGRARSTGRSTRSGRSLEQRGLPDDRHPHGRDGHPGHHHRRAAGASRSPTTWPASPRRGRAACWWSRSSCRSGPPTWSRSTPGGRSSRATASSTGCWRRSASQGPGLDELANAWLVLSYLWLPYMILPIYAGLERIPTSLLEASADLGGASRDDLPAGRPAARLPGARGRARSSRSR